MSRIKEPERTCVRSLMSLGHEFQAGNTRSLFGGHVFYNFQIETGYGIELHR